MLEVAKVAQITTMHGALRNAERACLVHGHVTFQLCAAGGWAEGGREFAQHAYRA